MDRLQRTHFTAELNGRVYLSQNRAFGDLAKNGGPPEAVPADLARGMI